MKRIILIFVIAIAAITGSCTKKVDTHNTIKFWHFWSEPNQKKVIQELVAEFEKANDCKVEMTELSWNDGKTKLMAAFNSRTSPDVLELGSDWIPQFSSSGVLLELKNSIDFSNFLDYSREPAKWQGKYYAAPWVVDTRVLFYNKDLMQKAGIETSAPATFTKMLEYANLINDGNSIYGFGANGSDPHRLYKKIVPMFWTFGGDIFDSKGKPVINSQANIEALQMYIDLSHVGMIETQRQLDAAFAQGKIGFWFSGAWLIDKIKNENPSLNYGISPIPGKINSPGVSFAGGEYLAVSVNSKKKSLAEKFVQFLTDGSNSLKICKKINEAGFPADKRFFKDSYFASNPSKSVFASQLANSKMTPVHPQWLDIEAIIENAVVQAIYGKADARTALDNAQYEINMLLANGTIQ